jgi:hypothetical protein
MPSPQPGFVLGQRRAFATLALVIALLSFVNLAGLEKAILAIVLGIRALSSSPEPALDQRRNWARTAAVLGAAHIILLVTIILMNLDKLSKIVDAFRALSDLQ